MGDKQRVGDKQTVSGRQADRNILTHRFNQAPTGEEAEHQESDLLAWCQYHRKKRKKKKKKENWKEASISSVIDIRISYRN